MNDLQDDSLNYQNLVQGYLWKNRKLEFQDKFYLSLFIFFDDFQTGNPLRSHATANKLGACYVSIASLPPKYSSCTKYISLALLFHSEERSNYGNAAVFKPLINELNSLYKDGLVIHLKLMKTYIFTVREYF